MIKKVKCPNCGTLLKWDKSNSFRPFCSERCRLIDLGDWANESHSIPADTFNDDTYSQYNSEKLNQLDDTST